MSPKKFKEIRTQKKHAIVWKIVKGEIKQKEFTNRQWKIFLGGK